MATDRFPGGTPTHLPRAMTAREEPATARHPVAAGSALSVNCEERKGLVVLRLAGDLDTYTTPGFTEHVRRYDPAEVQLVIDLTGVGLLDSAGLSALVSLRNRAHREGARLGLVCPDRRLVRLFWFTGLRPAFAFGDELPAVCEALAPRADPMEPGRARAR